MILRISVSLMILRIFSQAYLPSYLDLLKSFVCSNLLFISWVVLWVPLYLHYTFFARNKICKICGIYCYCFQVLFQRANDLILLKSKLNVEDPMEKEMVTHNSILAWEILWTEEPVGLQSMRFQRVSHNLATKQQHTHAHTHIYKERGRKKRMAFVSIKIFLPNPRSFRFFSIFL